MWPETGEDAAMIDLFSIRDIDAYAGIKKVGMPSLDLIFSLIELGLRIPSELNRDRRHQNHLECDQRLEKMRPWLTCSPSERDPDEGATTDLFRRLIDAYAGIKKVGMPSLDLIFSLIELGRESKWQFVVSATEARTVLSPQVDANFNTSANIEMSY
jgi:hypothetical protein